MNADDHQLMITKGAVEEMEEVCTHAQINGEIVPLSTAVREELRRVNVQMNKQGMRVLAVAVKKMSIKKQFIQLKMKKR